MDTAPQIILVLDIDKPVAMPEIRVRLPTGGARHELLLSQFDAPTVRRFGPDKDPVDWAGIGAAILRMIQKARALEALDSAPAEFVIAGHAPLAAFALVGSELSAWARRVTVVNQRKDGSWAIVPATSATPTAGVFFDVASAPLATASESDGRVVVFVSTGPLALKDAIRALLHESGERLATLVEIRTSAPKDLDSDNGPIAARELAELFASLRGIHPYASGFAAFVAGPAQLAVLVGRAINPTVLTDVWLTNLDGEAYEVAFALPWRGTRRRALSVSGDDRIARRAILDAFNAGLRELRDVVSEKDMPPESFPLTAADRKAFFDTLQSLKELREHDGDDEAFRLDHMKDELGVSASLLEALRLQPAEIQKSIGQGLILHELFHLSQGIHSSDYRGVGRAGVALEEVDYWADAFALGLLAAARVRDRGDAGKRDVAKITSEYTGATLSGITAFDRMEQGSRIETLHERRLRRYLIWHLQHLRAQTLGEPEDIWRLFGSRLVVELAPLEGGLDPRSDKVVRRADPERTELFVVLDAHLAREGRSPSFSPAELVDAVRVFNDSKIHSQLRYVLDRHAPLLAPWRTRRVAGR